MRIVALSLALLSIGSWVSAEEVDEAHSTTGKSPEWISFAPNPQAPPQQLKAADPPPQKVPPHGQPFAETLVPPDYGEALETPNQRRHRLGLPPDVTPDPVYGVLEETPNQQKKRIALAPR